MSEPDISTLARRLAEQNNVDWRALRGSGPEGKVVERDVLDYLARVMAGSEALDPTPEPLPEGMEAWPEQGLADFRQAVSANAASFDDGSDEFAAAEGRVQADSFGRESFEPAQAVAAEASEEVAEELLDEDIFLFDDEQGGASLADGASSSDAVDELDDLLVAGDDQSAPPATWSHPDAAFAAGENEPVGAEFGGPAVMGADAAEVEDDVFGAAQDLGDGGTDEEFGADFVGGYGHDQHARGGELDDLTMSGSGFLSASGQDDEDDDLPDLFAGPTESFAEDAGDFGSDDLFVAAGETFAADAAESPGDDLFVAAGETLAAGVAESVGDDLFGEEVDSFADGDSGFAASVADEVASEDAAVETFAYPPITAEAPATDAGDGAFGAPVHLEAAELPLARTQTLLRRVVDLSSLASAQLAVSLELGDSEPLSAAPFLLRAVAKALTDTSLGSGPVALAELAGGVRLRRIDDAATRSFGSLIAALNGDFSEEDEPALAVVDLGPLDLDEVILDLQVPVVSLGRVLYDTQRGGYRSTLTLAGAVQPDTGARLLARVAELLDAPVRLVV